MSASGLRVPKDMCAYRPHCTHTHTQNEVLFSLTEKEGPASKMCEPARAQSVKALPTRLDSMSVTPATHMVEEDHPLKAGLWPLHNPFPQVNTYNKKCF